ncbi:MAG: hypothetical protein APR53_04230 [Methanoculleus sp. SDB]|nr:MAG: hypothetical protein APR53_04230 [Methanoculleus sp. SDB]
MAPNERWIKNRDTFALGIIGAVAILVILAMPGITFSKNNPGMFYFDDDTTGGWALDQLYNVDIPGMKIINPGPQQPNYHEPFALQKFNNIGLTASTISYHIANESITKTEMYFVSPNLTQNTFWQQIRGYELDVWRNFVAMKGSTGYAIQLQLKYAEDSDWISENDSLDQSILHPIDLKKGYHITWKQLDPNTPKAVERIRIRCVMPGYYFTMNDFLEIDSGEWRIGKICPIK